MITHIANAITLLILLCYYAIAKIMNFLDKQAKRGEKGGASLLSARGYHRYKKILRIKGEGT